MERFIFKVTAQLVIPFFVSAILLRVFQILAWPWWLSFPAAGLLFWHYCAEGAEASERFLEENSGKALRFDPCLQFLAQSFLWSSVPLAVAAVAYCVFPLLLPDRGSSPLGIISGDGLRDGNPDLREVWYQFIRELPREGVLGLRFVFALVFGLIVLGLKAQVEKVDEAAADDHHHRGRKQITLKEAARNAAKLRKAKDPGIFFGGVQLPSTWAVLHFLFI